MTPALIPELCVSDVTGAEALLCEVFGFRSVAPGRLRLGGQVIEIVAADGPAGHGLIDHLALAVVDVDAALQACLARGGLLAEVTPDGPMFIPEFWTAGVRYVFLDGPDGARLELCARPGVMRPGLPGHDHIGIACRDLPAMRHFFLSLGMEEVAATTLIRPEGEIPVCFLSLGATVVELYTPPGLSQATHVPGFWRRLVLEGGEGSGPLTGPEGLEILRRPAVRTAELARP
jgi:catechol 2,3-dioxygenase-like lactoylglutathione lyase family enzyme